LSERQKQRSKKKDTSGTFRGVPMWTNAPTGQRAHHPEFIKLWGEYLEEGMSCKHVAEAVGVSHASVRKHYPDRVWNRKQILEHSHVMRAVNRIR